MKIYELVIATAAAAWPMSLVAQDAAGTRLGIATQKTAIGGPDKAGAIAAVQPRAGTDPKLPAPGDVVLGEPELAEVPGASGPHMARVTKPTMLEPSPGPKSAEAAGIPAGDVADGALESAALSVDRAIAAEPAPPATVETGDLPQAPADEGAPADFMIALDEAGPAETAPEELGIGEEMTEQTRIDMLAFSQPSEPEVLEPLARSDLALPADPEFAEGPTRGGGFMVASAEVFTEEMREFDPSVLVTARVAKDSTLEAAPLRALVEPDTQYATVTEEVVTPAEALVLAAMADDPKAPFVEKSMTDPNEIACLEIMGEPNAGVPVSQEVEAANRAKLAQAVPACEAAAAAPNPSPEVLFYAAEIARAKNDAGAAFELLQQASDAGLGAAVTRLGDFYLFGAAPGGRDLDKAVEQFTAGAELGDPAAMTSLAMMHRAAIGVPQDSARMVELLTQAAEKGYHFAQYRLAQTYYNGDGIPGRADPALGIPDPARAVSWYTQAADAGNLEAALELAGLYSDPASGLPDNPAEQARLTKMAADTGLPSAIASMGVLYETGRGVPASPDLAAEYYIRALETGEITFDTMRPNGPPVWDQATAIAFQTALAARGVYPGVIDGLVGAGTRAAADALAAGG